MYDKLFVGRYPPSDRRGRNWLRHVTREDRVAFARIGRSAVDTKLGKGGLASLGGKARAAKATERGQRDRFGRYWNTDTLTKVYRPWDIHNALDGIIDVDLDKGEPIVAHSYWCIFTTAVFAFKRWQWAQKWPNHCPKCEGHGHSLDGEDACPNCIEQGCCPRCGKQAWLATVDFDRTCPFCDWNDLSAMFGDAEQTGLAMPAEMECACYEREIDQIVEKYLGR